MVKEIHRFSVYARFLATMLPKGQGEQENVDDKVLLEYYRLEKDFAGEITLESPEDGFRPITGEAGWREKKEDPLTAIIEKINEKYGTAFTKADMVLFHQFEEDYEAEEKWHSYAENNDYKTFILLFEKDFPTKAAVRFERNESLYVHLFDDPDMMKQVMETVGMILYERLKRKRGRRN